MSEPPIFLLSPARCDGRRAGLLFNPSAAFELAVNLREKPQPIGGVFAFLSGLYFRGKLTYATTFGRHTVDQPGVFVITANRGLLPPETPISLDELKAFARVDLGSASAEFQDALRRDALRIHSTVGPARRIVLLGSIATGKYVDVLGEIFDQRLLFPADFVGRGDMSRGGLMLRSVSSGQELSYVPVLGAVRHGKRPPKLERLRPAPSPATRRRHG
jgi:hypothetical protein